MPTYLGKYNTAGKEREMKLSRAVQSVINQSYQNWELIIIADGCQKSVDIIQENRFLNDERISMYLIDKCKIWSGTPRNIGIKNAKGKYIIYLDADDIYDQEYLIDLSKEVADRDWYIVDDIVYRKTKAGWETIIRPVNVNVHGQCGTSNIIHKTSLNCYWNVNDNYSHDYRFLNILKAVSEDYQKINIAGYVVCHIPNIYDL